MQPHPYTQQSIELLTQMIGIPSISREEEQVADRIYAFLLEAGLRPVRKGNNIWVHHPGNQPDRSTILLNSHVDTVRPASGWKSDPFEAIAEGDRLTGLGSNDAGASVVSLLAAFRRLSEKTQPCNFIFAATAEEEISGQNGLAAILEELGPVDLAVVGEPTGMNMAVAEKGLMVIDGLVTGKTGHAARNEGVNAIYKALPIIEWFRNTRMPLESDFLGPVKMTVTGVEAGTQHNVVPDTCRFVVDVRVNEHYTNAELFSWIEQQVPCELKARSFRLNSSSVSLDHPIVKRGEALGLRKFGSPTTSDQALMPFSSVKIGPGDSARSHTPNEYILLSEIEKGVEVYFKLLDQLNIHALDA